MVARRIQGLVLSHLALLTGCDGPMPAEPVTVAPVEEPPAQPSATASAAAPLATATATATASTSATTVATGDAPPPPPPSASAAPQGAGEMGAPCNDRSDCKAGLYCRLGFTGAEFIRPGACTDEKPIYRGRPLVVDGARHEAALGPDGGWLDGGLDVPPDPALAAELRDAAREEHASVAAFGRTLCALCALGAPPSLLQGTQAAIADEIRHTQICLRWAEALDGASLAPGALPAATAPFGHDVAAELLVDVFRGGCVGETLAAAELLEQAGQLEGPLAADLEAMAEDETRHAALAFATVRWLVETRPHLATALTAELDRFVATSTPPQRRLVGPLVEQLG